MTVPQMVQLRLLEGASGVPSSGAGGFLIGGFLLFTGTSAADVVTPAANSLIRFHSDVGRGMNR